jgi:hypothetical protein
MVKMKQSSKNLKTIGGKSETTTTVLNETGKGEVEIKMKD